MGEVQIAGERIGITANGDGTSSFNMHLPTTIAGEDITNDVMKVEQQFGGTFLTSAGTVVVKTGVGFLHSMIVTGGSAGAITLCDGTSIAAGTIAAFDSTNALQTYPFNRRLTAGLTVVTAAATKVALMYR
jgi:hypothetical protein